MITADSCDYDLMRNLIAEIVDGEMTTDEYNAANQLTTATIAGQLFRTYEYDEFGRYAGSTVGSYTSDLTWNDLGQLSEVVMSDDATATYAYGIDGMRQMKVVDDGTTESTTYSVWSGNNVISELDDDGTRYDYLYGPNAMPLQLMVTASNGTTSTYAYQVDHGGSVIGMTDEDGDEVARYAYDPYGGLVGMSGDPIATRNPLRYRGYYYDNETQLYYLPARYYNPDTGRFLSVDPAPPTAGDPMTLNGYAYCAGDPVQLVDPDGEEPHGYNMPDGYGEDGYNNNGYGDDKSSMQEAQTYAAVVILVGDLKEAAPGLVLDFIKSRLPAVFPPRPVTNIGDGSVDVNGSYIFVPTRIPGVGLGITGGTITNTPEGWPTDPKRYAGVAIGRLNTVSGSVTGSPWMSEKYHRYAEFSYFARGKGISVGDRVSVKPGESFWTPVRDPYIQAGTGTTGWQANYYVILN